MKVIVVGATGSIGRHAVRDLLEQGCEVTAFARTPSKLALAHERLRLNAGDALIEEDVAQAVAGHDAVIVALGSGMARTSKVRSIGTANVVRGMQRHGVRRLICQSTLGAHESRGNLDFFWRRIMFGLLLRPVLIEHEKQELLVRESGLDWTIVRPSAFVDGPATGTFREGFGPRDRDLALRITRADVAAFLVRELALRRYAGAAVGISG